MLRASGGAFFYGTFTNALTGRPDSRTAPFLAASFTHSRTALEVTAGARQTEGAIDLWAPAGPSVGMRLSQLELRGHAFPLDSLLRVRGRAALNRVRYAGLSETVVVNTGHTLDLQVGYRFLDAFYGGLLFSRTQYARPSEFFFAPVSPPYELYEVFAEYETPRVAGQPYVRVLAAVGTVAHSAGFLTRRVEGDLIYPLAANLNVGVNLRVSDSGRVFPDGVFSGYSIFILSAALYLGL